MSATKTPAAGAAKVATVKRKIRPGPVPAADLRAAHPDLFGDMSERFLDWNFGAVVRRHYRDGEIICRQGEYGSTAFIIEYGKVEIRIKTSGSTEDESGGIFSKIFGFLNPSYGAKADTASSKQQINLSDAPVTLRYGDPVAAMDRRDRIFGEMACMNNYPRSATIRARGDVVVLEILRNVVYMMQRTRRSRETLRDLYRARVLDNHLRQVPLFQSLFAKNPAQSEKFVESLREKVDLIRSHPKKTIFRKGDAADAFYMVRTGFVKVAAGDMVLNYIGPGGYFGEIGLLSGFDELKGLTPEGKRTATCSALDHVDLVRIRRDDFLQILQDFPDLKAELLKTAAERLRANEAQSGGFLSPGFGPFLDQGLYNAQSLLVLDLEKCTRCDECAKACADAHPDRISRLTREGLRFDKFLVASACRSCYDPFCMVGCPVGSIHRDVGKEVVIKDWCIGCGKCAENCPYGNINLHPVKDDEGESKLKAFTCDLCTKLNVAEPSDKPSCVYACPHDAAHRMTGPQLWQIANPLRTE